MATSSKSPFTQAQWIWTTGKNRISFHVSYFRKTFELKSVPRKMHLHCAADSKYRLWVNGVYVGFGPARGHKDHPYYDTHDVAAHLKKGSNTIAFLVQHYTLGSPIFSVVEGGLICQANDEKGNALIATDSSWKAMPSKAYTSIPGVIFCESLDARLEPENWQMPGFQDSSWKKARVLNETRLAPPDALYPRPIPPLTETPRYPVRLLDVGLCVDEEQPNVLKEEDICKSASRMKMEPIEKGVISPELVPQTAWKPQPLVINPPKDGKAVYLALDFGTNRLAAMEIEATGPAGAVIDLAYTEMLENNRIGSRMGGIPNNDRTILRKGRTTHYVLQPRGYRFALIRIANFTEKVTIHTIRNYESIYPARKVGQFRCSDPVFERIYELCRHTVNTCMEDGFTDCPWRERSQWLGDFQPEALFAYYLFGAWDIVRKALREYGSGNTEAGWIPGIFPVTDPPDLPTWGMRFPVIAWEYFIYTGDRESLEAVYSGVQRQMAYLGKYENTSGLLEDLPGWKFTDWTRLDAGGADGVVQGWYLEALESSARIAAELGRKDEAGDFTRRAGRLRKIMPKAFWSKKRKAFLKYTPMLKNRRPDCPPDIIGQQENFLFSLLSIGSATQRRSGLDALRGATGKYLPNLGNYQSFFPGVRQDGNYSAEDTIYIGSPFFSFYALLALMEAGREEAALEYIRIGWGLMLDHGATTCWEMWDRNTSLCHGWSAGPAMILPAYVLGVKPTRPGYAEFEIRPRLCGLKWADGVIPAPQGVIKVYWSFRPDGSLTCRVQVPKASSAHLIAPKGFQCPDGQKTVRLDPGRHTLVLQPARK